MGRSLNYKVISDRLREKLSVVEHHDFARMINDLIRDNTKEEYGTNLEALYQLYVDLTNMQKRQWYSELPGPLKEQLTTFLGDHSYIKALHEMITTVIKRKSHLFPPEMRLNLSRLLRVEFSAEDLFFQFFAILQKATPSIPDLDFKDDLQNFVRFSDSFSYFRVDRTQVTIADVTTFTDMAHALFCHVIMNLGGEYLSLERRQLISGIFDYLKHVSETSANISDARHLLVALYSQSSRSLAEILESDFPPDRLASQQGVIKRAGEFFGRWSSYAQQIAKPIAIGFTYLADSIGKSHFVSLVDSFRGRGESPVKNPIDRDVSSATELLTMINDRLQTLRHLIDPTTQVYKLKPEVLEHPFAHTTTVLQPGLSPT